MENTKDMKKDVLITIKGTQKIGNEKDVIEMVTTGRFYRKIRCTTSATRRPRQPVMKDAAPL